MLVGTFKRALSTGRWLFIFDGLDEVPTDSKDTVAIAVTDFIDNQLIEAESDTLSICTSRPQGYSGQFSDLCAAVVELSALDPQQALDCATPILKLGRPIEEGQRNVTILRDALSNHAITEIMKTPLQAHIMAVVVRDGGRPPERRWQLYDNFYRVVKKREAAKASPNRGLAILLREGDRLIKALHNSLGFNLHRRAETSDGSDTSILRSELQTIVYNVTSELLQDQINETTDILMEATTDRLVLVNTPEAGDKVRFDVRQLQEFFAAEYVYEGVDGQLLRHRLSVISADQHWREVMHFILSALVENKRQADLSAAIAVLNHIDDSEDDQDRRIFNKRLAVGSLITARLLHEGVLEQDKKDRQQFRDSLQGILSSTSATDLYPLFFMEGSQSKAWLQDLVVSHIVEKQPHENIGAAYLALFLLPDNHKRLQSVVKMLGQADAQYKCCLMVMYATEALASRRELPQWSLEWVFRFLLSDDSRTLSQHQLSSLFSRISMQSKLAEAIAVAGGLEEHLAEKIAPSVMDWYHPRGERPTIAEQKVGPVSIHFYTAPPELNTVDWTEEVWGAVRKLKGVFSNLAPVLDVFSSSTKEEYYSNLISFMHRVSGRPFPKQWTIFLPCEWNFIGSDMSKGHYILSNRWNDIRHVPGSLQSVLIMGGTETSATDLEQFIQRFPTLMLDFLLTTGRIIVADKDDFLSTDKATALIFEVSANYSNLILQSPELWGRLIELNESFADKFRRLFLQIASEDIDFSIVRREVYPIMLELPNEAELLPGVLKVVLGSMWESDAYYTDVRTSSRKRRDNARSLVLEYIASPECLIAVMDDCGQDKIIRACAAMLYLLHPDDLSFVSDRCLDIIAQNYQDAPTWYVAAVGASVIEKVPDDERCVRLMGRLLDLGREDYMGRFALKGVLDVWRERSSAPVQTSAAALF